MNPLTKTGRLLYGIGSIAVGIHQLILRDFRSEILPPFPAWAHTNIVFPILAGIALVFAGIIISGLFKNTPLITKKTCLYLGFCFLVLIVTCHLPYIFFINPYKLSRLDVWFGLGGALAYCGGAFAIAGSFTNTSLGDNRNNLETFLEKIIPCGRIFFASLMILFGYSHFVFTDFIAKMVPSFFGVAVFWIYFTGTALIAAGIAIILKIWTRPVGFLLAAMLFVFFVFFHVPDAIANPSARGGNEIIRAIVALMYCGIALVIATTAQPRKHKGN